MLIEPKPREPTKHQYDYDAQTVMGFLKTHALEEHYKINVYVSGGRVVVVASVRWKAYLCNTVTSPLQ
jgi:xylose isomerase